MVSLFLVKAAFAVTLLGMGRGKPVELPSKSFATRTEATEFFKAMLGSYKDWEQVSEEHGKLLYELLLRHPDEKIGVGVDHFFKAPSPDHPNSCFHIKRIDEQPTDFSYPACIKGEKPTPGTYFYRACRHAVSPYLTIKKNQLFEDGPVYCAKTGEKVAKDTSEYRHTSPAFKELVKGFIQEKSIMVAMDLFVDDRDMQYSVRFKDAALTAAFVEYHQEHASMAVIKKGQTW